MLRRQSHPGAVVRGSREWFHACAFGGAGAKDGQSWRTHHVATIRKVRNRLINISTRSRARHRRWHGQRPALRQLRGPEVYVVDVANLEEDAQDLIFARVVSKLREHLERRDSVSSTWSCSWTSSTSTRRPMGRTPTCGRCCSTSRSAAATSAWCCSGRSSFARRCTAESWATPAPRSTGAWTSTSWRHRATHVLPATKTKLATLDKGELMVRHPHFTQPIFVRFPRPAVLGREGAERFPPVPSFLSPMQ